MIFSPFSWVDEFILYMMIFETWTIEIWAFLSIVHQMRLLLKIMLIS